VSLRSNYWSVVSVNHDARPRAGHHAAPVRGPRPARSAGIADA